MNRLWAHIKLLRPLNLFTGALAVLASAAILDTLHLTSRILLAIGVVVCYNSAANAINDYFDYATDRVNRPRRPLVTRAVKQNSAILMAVMLFTLGSILVFFLPQPARIVALGVALPLLILYSVILKGLPLVGNGVVAGILGLTFLFAGTALGNVEPMVVPALLAFGLTLLRELVKDIADMQGDQEAGLRTFPVVTGLRTASVTAVLLVVLTGVGVTLPYWMGYYGMGYLSFLIAGVEIPLLYIGVQFIRSPGEVTAYRAAGLLKFSTIAGIVAVYLG